MKYKDPACAYCPPTVRACSRGKAEERGPGFCPTKVDPDTQSHARALYDDPETRKISREAAIIESEGYCKWTRVEEIIHFAKRMGYKIEALCNPVSQAELLNEHGCEFNVVMGLCIGHDSLFFRYAKGLTTVLVAKDRVLGHNPVAALHLADTYYNRLWGPNKPAKPPKLPPAGRRDREA